jgi:hypothetical protein
LLVIGVTGAGSADVRIDSDDSRTALIGWGAPGGRIWTTAPLASGSADSTRAETRISRMVSGFFGMPVS